MILQNFTDDARDELPGFAMSRREMNVFNESGKMTVYSDVEAWLTQHAILREIALQDLKTEAQEN